MSFAGLNEQLNSLHPFEKHRRVVPLAGVLADIHATSLGINAAGKAAKQLFEEELARQEKQHRLDAAHEVATEAHAYQPRHNRNE
jgi:hypothetical protein